MAKFYFTPEEDETIVECISQYPALYDTREKDYKDFIVRENIWKVIAGTVNRTVADCKKRWRNIRDTYFKQRKGIKGSTGTVAKGKSKWPLLERLDFLNAVPYERSAQSNTRIDKSQTIATEDVPTHGTAEQVNDETLQPQDNNSSSATKVGSAASSTDIGKKRKILSSKCPPRKKLKDVDNTDKILDALEKTSLQRQQLLNTIVTNHAEELDPVTMFFKSMAMTVKTFSPALIAEAKLRIFNVVSELEIRSLNQPKQTTQDSRPGTSFSGATSDSESYIAPFSLDFEHTHL